MKKETPKNQIRSDDQKAYIEFVDAERPSSIIDYREMIEVPTRGDIISINDTDYEVIKSELSDSVTQVTNRVFLKIK